MPPSRTAGGRRFEMRSASSGLRHPASASCLGRHLRLAGRCPNNSSLFPPLAAVVVVASHIQRKKYFKFWGSGKSADFPEPLFHRWGRKGKRQLPRLFPAETVARRENVLALSVCSLRSHPPLPKGEALAEPEGLHLHRKVCRHAKGSPFEERLPPLRGKMSPQVTKGGIWTRSGLRGRGCFNFYCIHYKG